MKTPVYKIGNTLRGPVVQMQYNGLTLQSPPLWNRSACEPWKAILLDAYHRIQNGGKRDGVTDLGDGKYLIAGLL